MSRYEFSIDVHTPHRVIFAHDAFAGTHPDITALFSAGGRALVFIEESVACAWPGLSGKIHAWLASLPGIEPSGSHIHPGGEACKDDDSLVRIVWQAIHDARIDRHSFVLAIGGGAFLDAIGFATATAHRGVRLVRFPTTTLAQDDSSVGVKCAINAFGKKNWLGTFAVPHAVIIDFDFLATLDPATRREGLVEAVKVALVKDAGFFHWIEDHLSSLAALDVATVETCVQRSALLHAEHIAHSGDPFERGSSRPLDFGHWAAHKLEAMTSGSLSHARAVAIGMALDTSYAVATGLAPQTLADRVAVIFAALALPRWHPAMAMLDASGKPALLSGLDDFREHLGGNLTVLMPTAIGSARDIHSLDEALLTRCIAQLAP